MTDEGMKKLKDLRKEYEFLAKYNGGEDYIAFKVLDMAVKELSNSEIPNKWIPTSERNPEKDGFYIVTMDGEICGEDEPFVGLAEFYLGRWLDDEDDYKCVLAWQELPKPYKAESDVKE